MKRICKQCGKEFEITDSEAQFYKDKGLQLPKRCKQCREENKRNNASISNLQSEKQAKNSSPDYKPVVFGVVIIAVVLAFALFFLRGSLFGGKETTTVMPPTSTTAVTTTVTQTTEPPETTTKKVTTTEDEEGVSYHFTSADSLESHFQKHGAETGCATREEYLRKANAVITNPNALHKYETEDGDDVYFVASTGEICFVSPKGKIRTYFIADKAYFDKQ